MVVDAALLERAGELKRELVEFSQQPRYERAVSRFLEEYGGGTAVFDEQRMMLLWDSFVLEHKLANGRTVVEQFVDASPGLSGPEREMLLGRRDVVQGPLRGGTPRRHGAPGDQPGGRPVVPRPLEHGHGRVPADAPPSRTITPGRRAPA